MNENKRDLVKNLLDSVGKSGPEMTHMVSELGDGNMSKGFNALFRCGIIVGAGAVTALVATYHVVKAVAESTRIKRELLNEARDLSCASPKVTSAEEISPSKTAATDSPDTYSEGDESVITRTT